MRYTPRYKNTYFLSSHLRSRELFPVRSRKKSNVGNLIERLPSLAKHCVSKKKKKKIPVGLIFPCRPILMKGKRTRLTVAAFKNRYVPDGRPFSPHFNKLISLSTSWYQVRGDGKGVQGRPPFPSEAIPPP